jgi:hypothetical protein
MKEVMLLFLMLIFSGAWIYRRRRARYISNSTDSVGCIGAVMAIAVVIFLIVTLIYQDELLDAVGRRFVE